MKKKLITRPKQMAVSISKEQDLYEKDFNKWALNQSKYLKKGEFDKLDIAHLTEEIADLGKNERDKLISHIANFLMHKLKIKYQPKKQTKSWDLSVRYAKYEANEVLEENPSLKPMLKTYFQKAFQRARLVALIETGLDESEIPEECEWQLKDIFENLEKKYQ